MMLLCFSLFHSPSSPCLFLLRPASGDRATGRAALEWPLTLKLSKYILSRDIPPVPRRRRWYKEFRGQKEDTEPEDCWKDCQGPHLPLLQRGNCGRFVSGERLLLHSSSLLSWRLNLELGSNTDCTHEWVCWRNNTLVTHLVLTVL